MGGLNYYFYALTAHFGHWQPPEAGQRKPRWVVSPQLWYGQLIKRRRRYRLVALTYRVPLGGLEGLQRRLRKLKLGRALNTAFVERVNLTLRHNVSALSRRTWATDGPTPRQAGRSSEMVAGLLSFCACPHRALRQALDQPRARGPGRWAQRYRARTPAQAAGLTPKRWSTVELLSFPLPAQASR